MQFSSQRSNHHKRIQMNHKKRMSTENRHQMKIKVTVTILLNIISTVFEQNIRRFLFVS